MMVRNSLRELRISPSTVSIFSRASIWCRPRFSHAEAGPGQNPYEIAGVYAFRNQSDEAFEWLDRAYVQRNAGLIETKVDPLLKSLHHDPRFASQLKKLNFPI
jgi:hypothetical protein